MTKEKTLLQKVHEIPVFENLGKPYKIEESEIQTLREYAKTYGGDPDYVEKVVRGMGRPLSLYDSDFKGRCMICRQLRNYCCC